MATTTPWGPSQWSEKVATGVMVYETASHGGYHLSPKRNQQIPEHWRMRNGWYEEDCGWAPLALTFPELFPPESQEPARRVVAAWEGWVIRCGG